QADLGANLSSIIRRDVRELTRATNDMVSDFSQMTAAANRTVADLQRDMAGLTRLLSSNPSATIHADVTALTSALAALAGDLAMGVSPLADLSAAVAAELKLETDLGANPSKQIENRLDDIGDDLMDLGIQLSAMEG